MEDAEKTQVPPPPACTMVPDVTPPLYTISPAPLTTVPEATPPRKTYSEPPLGSILLSVAPPDRIFRLFPLLTVRPELVWPDEMNLVVMRLVLSLPQSRHATISGRQSEFADPSNAVLSERSEERRETQAQIEQTAPPSRISSESVFSVFSVVPLQLPPAWVPAFAGMSGDDG